MLLLFIYPDRWIVIFIDIHKLEKFITISFLLITIYFFPYSRIVIISDIRISSISLVFTTLDYYLLMIIFLIFLSP